MITKEFDTIAAISAPLGEGLSVSSAWAGQTALPLRKRSSKERFGQRG